MSTPAPEALRRLLRPGDCLVWGQGAAEPLTATAALLDPAKRIADPAFQPALEREMHAMLRDG